MISPFLLEFALCQKHNDIYGEAIRNCAYRVSFLEGNTTDTLKQQVEYLFNYLNPCGNNSASAFFPM